MNKWLLVLVLVVVVGGGYFLMKGKTPSAPSESMQPTTEEGSTGPSAAGTLESATGASGTMTEEGNVKAFTVEGTPFKFSLTEMRVKKGDTVKVTFVNKQGFHDWVLDEFNVRTKQIQAPGTETVTFVADKAGTFEYYCSVDGHRAKGMKGNLIVE